MFFFKRILKLFPSNLGNKENFCNYVKSILNCTRVHCHNYLFTDTMYHKGQSFGPQNISVDGLTTKHHLVAKPYRIIIACS